MSFIENNLVAGILTIIVLTLFLAVRYFGKKPITLDILVTRFFLASSVVVGINLLWFGLFRDYFISFYIDTGVYLILSGIIIFWLAATTIKEDMSDIKTGKDKQYNGKNYSSRLKLNVGQTLSFGNRQIRLADIGIKDDTSPKAPAAFDIFDGELITNQIKLYVGQEYEINKNVKIELIDVMAGFTLSAKWVEIGITDKK